MPQDIEFSSVNAGARAEQRLDRHQRMMEGLTTALGRPRTVYVTCPMVAGWVAFNLVMPICLVGGASTRPRSLVAGIVACPPSWMTTLFSSRRTARRETPKERSHPPTC